jgi:hypothetical protein
MKAAVAAVAAAPGCPKIVPARAAGPHGSLKYGYQAVDRAIRAGLIRAEPGPRGYRLTVTAPPQEGARDPGVRQQKRGRSR